MTRFSFLLCLGLATGCPAACYYVDSRNGDDSRAGATADASWKTLGRLQRQLSENDHVFLRAGERWDESLLLDRKVDGLLLDKYGEGADPIISAADRARGWKRDEKFHEAMRWRREALGWTPRHVWLCQDGRDSIYVPIESLEAATRQGVWHYEPRRDTLWVVLPEGIDPNDPRTEVNVGRRDVCIRAIRSQKNVTLQNLHLKYTNAAAREQWGAIHGEGVVISGWHLKNLLIEWADLGTKLAGDFTPEGGLNVEQVEIRYCREHGFNATHFTHSKVHRLHTHDNGRSGGQFIFRDSIIEESETDHNADKNHHWPESQRAVVQPYDSAFYVVGDEARMLPAGGNIIRRCRSHHNAKAGMATDALCDNNIFENNLIYLNDLMGLFFEGGTNNGSQGNRAFNNTFYRNGRVASGNFHVDNGHGFFEARNNLFVGGKNQEVGISWHIFAWNRFSGAIYRREHMRWKPGRVGDEQRRLLTPGAAADRLEPGQYFYDANHETLYARQADDAPITVLHVSPLEKWIMDSNCYLTESGRILWEETPGSTTVVYSKLSELQKGEAQELHGKEADPRFVSAEESDFHLRPGSVCGRAGENLSKRGLGEDFDARPRPKEGEGLWSMGAHE